MDEVHAVRDEYAADLVGLITAHKDSCGRAWLDATEPYGFSITGYNCEIGDYSFAHELGHNMGNSTTTDTRRSAVAPRSGRETAMHFSATGLIPTPTAT